MKVYMTSQFTILSRPCSPLASYPNPFPISTFIRMKVGMEIGTEYASSHPPGQATIFDRHTHTHNNNNISNNSNINKLNVQPMQKTSASIYYPDILYIYVAIIWSGTINSTSTNPCQAILTTMHIK